MKGYSFLLITRNFGNQFDKKAYEYCNKAHAPKIKEQTRKSGTNYQKI